MLKKNFYLRNPNSNDSDIIFKWSNEPYVRNNSFSKKKFLNKNIISGLKIMLAKKKKFIYFVQIII